MQTEKTAWKGGSLLCTKQPVGKISKYGKMHQHFSRVKDCVLVAVQRRDAGRATHGISFAKKKMREKKTALKSGSSPLALPSFPKLLTPLHKSSFSAKAPVFSFIYE